MRSNQFTGQQKPACKSKIQRGKSKNCKTKFSQNLLLTQTQAWKRLNWSLKVESTTIKLETMVDKAKGGKNYGNLKKREKC